MSGRRPSQRSFGFALRVVEQHQDTDKPALGISVFSFEIDMRFYRETCAMTTLFCTFFSHAERDLVQQHEQVSYIITNLISRTISRSFFSTPALSLTSTFCLYQINRLQREQELNMML